MGAWQTAPIVQLSASLPDLPLILSHPASTTRAAAAMYSAAVTATPLTMPAPSTTQPWTRCGRLRCPVGSCNEAGQGRRAAVVAERDALPACAHLTTPPTTPLTLPSLQAQLAKANNKVVAAKVDKL